MKTIKHRLLPLMLALLLIMPGCGSTESRGGITYETATLTPRPTPEPSVEEEVARISQFDYAAFVLSVILGARFPAKEFLRWLEDGAFPKVASDMATVTKKAQIEALMLRETGESLCVLQDRFSGILDDAETAREHGIYFSDADDGDIVLAFGGDVNLIEGSYVMPAYRASANGLSDVLAGGLLEEMIAADVLLLNNEFTFTDRGSALPGKMYSFRAPPQNVELLIEMGVDVAFLANNHVYDYGDDGLYDTLQTLDGAGIARIGAGMDIEEASKPVYYIVNGRKIAYVGAGCIERYSIFTPGASEDSPGIFRTDEKNAGKLLETIRDAVEESDFVVVNLHWGIESTSELEDYQRELGRMCIDAGADAVIGSHPHVLQGAEFYKGKPIIYSTGNFWFSTTNNYTCLLELIIDTTGDVKVKFLPCVTGGGITRLAEGETAASVLDYYESISFGVGIDSEGYITEAEYGAEE